MHVKMVCSECGGDNVKADAYATWDVANQRWECAETFDKGAYCDDCDGETRLEEREIIEGEAAARAAGLQVRHDMLGFYICTDDEAEHEDSGTPSAGFDGRDHWFSQADAWRHAAERAKLEG